MTIRQKMYQDIRDILPHQAIKPLSQLIQGSFIVRSRDFPATFLHSIFALANNIYVKVYLKTSLFSKSDLSKAIFHILAFVNICLRTLKFVL